MSSNLIYNEAPFSHTAVESIELEQDAEYNLIMTKEGDDLKISDDAGDHIYVEISRLSEFIAALRSLENHGV